MATSFSQVKPSSIKLKVQLRYPANVVGEDSIETNTSHGTLTIKSNYERLTATGGALSPTSAYFKGWNSTDGSFFRVSYSEMTAGATGAAAAAVAAQAAAEAAEAGAEAALAAAEVIALTGVLDVTGINGIDVTPGQHPIVSVRPAALINLCSNSGFELCAGLDLVIKIRANGSGGLPAFIVNSVSYTAGSGATPGTATINITPNAANEIKPNFLVRLAGAIDPKLLPIEAYSGGPSTALRVLSTTGSPVSSFKVLSPLGASSFSASSGNGGVYTPGDYSGASGNGPANWKKDVALLIAAEDDPVNFDPLGGSVRAIILSKGSSSEELIYQIAGVNRTISLQGQIVSFGSRLRQRTTEGGAGTARVFLQFDGVRVYGNSISGLGTYQWSSVTAAVPAGCTNIVYGVSLLDNASASFLWTKPIFVQGYLPINYYSKPMDEHIYPPGIHNAWSIYGKTFTMPAALLGSTPFYGFHIDLYGETGGQIHWSVSRIIGDMEGNSPTLPCSLITASRSDPLGLPGGSIMWQQVAAKTVALHYDQPLDNGMMILATGQSAKQLQEFNIDLYGVVTNSAAFY